MLCCTAGKSSTGSVTEDITEFLRTNTTLSSKVLTFTLKIPARTRILCDCVQCKKPIQTKKNCCANTKCFFNF